MSWWYLSFADDDGFRGAAIVEADTMLEAVRQTNVIGINPHGEVCGVRYPDDVPLPDTKYLNRLLTKEDVQKAEPGAQSIEEHKKEKG